MPDPTVRVLPIETAPVKLDAPEMPRDAPVSGPVLVTVPPAIIPDDDSEPVNSAPAIPNPPATTRAPVEVDVDAAVAVTVAIPLRALTVRSDVLTLAEDKDAISHDEPLLLGTILDKTPNHIIIPHRP